MPVHIYGRMCDMNAIMAIARRHSLKVVEDACEAHGAWTLVNDREDPIQWRKKSGSIGDIGCFSLFGNKIITAGEGGIIVTDDPKLAEEMRYLRGMAFEPTHTFLHRKVGYNFRMTNIQAAVALAQLESIEGFLEKRRKIQSWYDERIGKYSIPRPEGSVLWMYDVIVDEDKRQSVMDELAKKGIETRMFFKSMSQQPMYEAPYAHLNAHLYSKCGLYLPAYTQLNRKEVDFICQTFLAAVEK